MRKIIKIILCLLLISIIGACVNKKQEDIEEYKSILIDSKTSTKSCLITNNFYSDQCIETTKVNYKQTNYIELYYKYQLDFNFKEESDIKIKTKTIIVIEQDNKEIYSEEIDSINYHDIREESNSYTIEGSHTVYPDTLINKINKYITTNNLDKTTINSYIKTTVTYRIKGKIPETKLVEYTLTEESDILNITTTEFIK